MNHKGISNWKPEWILLCVFQFVGKRDRLRIQIFCASYVKKRVEISNNNIGISFENHYIVNSTIFWDQAKCKIFDITTSDIVSVIIRYLCFGNLRVWLTIRLTSFIMTFWLNNVFFCFGTLIGMYIITVDLE